MKQCVACSAPLPDEQAVCPYCNRPQPPVAAGPSVSGTDKLWGVFFYLCPLTMVIAMIVFLKRIGHNEDNDFLTTHFYQALPIILFESSLSLPLIYLIPMIGWASLLLPLPFFIFLLVFKIMGIVYVLSGRNDRIPIFGKFAN